MEQLKRLGDIVRELGEARWKQLYPESAAEENAATQADESEIGQQISALERVADDVTSRLLEYDRKVEFDFEVKEKDGTKFSGPYDLTIGQFDKRTAIGAVIKYKIGLDFDEALEVNLNGRRWANECELTVSSKDMAFGRSAFARLSDEVAKGVPRWAGGGKYVLALAVFIFLFSIAGTLVSMKFDGTGRIDFDWRRFPLGAIPASGIALAALGNSWPFSWLFPSFEVTGDGASSGTRRILSLVAVLITIPIGILINKIS